jgi:hypothetical protein
VAGPDDKPRWSFRDLRRLWQGGGRTRRRRQPRPSWREQLQLIGLVAILSFLVVVRAIIEDAQSDAPTVRSSLLAAPAAVVVPTRWAVSGQDIRDRVWNFRIVTAYPISRYKTELRTIAAEGVFLVAHLEIENLGDKRYFLTDKDISLSAPGADGSLRAARFAPPDSVNYARSKGLAPFNYAFSPGEKAEVPLLFDVDCRTNSLVLQIGLTPERVDICEMVSCPFACNAVYQVIGAGSGGLNLRIEPGAGERFKSWQDGAKLAPLGERRVINGYGWELVQDPQGDQGWVRSDFLCVVPSGPVSTSDVPASIPVCREGR